MAAQPVLDPERAAPVRRLAEHALGPRRVVGVHGAQPAEAQPVRERLPRELEPLPVEEGAHAVRLGHPEHHRRGVGHVAEARLALAQRPLGPRARRHVEHQRDHSLNGIRGGAAAAPAQRGVHEVDAVVLGHAVGVVVPARELVGADHRLAGGVDALQQREEVRPALAARQLGERLADRPADDVASADDPLVRRAQRPEAQLRPVHHRHRRRDLRDDLVEPLALAVRRLARRALGGDRGAQRTLPPALLGHVEHRADEEDGAPRGAVRPVVLEEHLPGGARPPLGAVGAGDAELGTVAAVARRVGGAGERGVHARPVVRVHALAQHLHAGPGRGVVEGEQLGHAGVVAGRVGGDVPGPGAQRRQLGGEAVTRLARPQRRLRVVPCLLPSPAHPPPFPRSPAGRRPVDAVQSATQDRVCLRAARAARAVGPPGRDRGQRGATIPRMTRPMIATCAERGSGSSE